MRTNPDTPPLQYSNTPGDLTRIIHEIASEKEASPVVFDMLTTLSKIEGRPMGQYLEEDGGHT